MASTAIDMSGPAAAAEIMTACRFPALLLLLVVRLWLESGADPGNADLGVDGADSGGSPLANRWDDDGFVVAFRLTWVVGSGRPATRPMAGIWAEECTGVPSCLSTSIPFRLILYGESRSSNLHPRHAETHGISQSSVADATRRDTTRTRNTA
jgi:hypothetical protein